MANTTFNGPVRSEGGFEQISKASGTGAITTNLDIEFFKVSMFQEFHSSM